MSKIRRMFPGGNTSKGFVSFHDNIIGEDRNKLYILKGMPGGGKSSLMNNIAERMLEKGFSIEYHHCPSDPKSIDGIVIEELKVAIVDGTAPHIIDPTYPGLTEKLIDLSEFINSDILKEKAEDIIKAKKENKCAYRKAFNYLNAAKIIQEEIVETNKKMMDFTEVNKVTKELIDEIFEKQESKIINDGFQIRHLFSSAISPEGYVDYTDSLLEKLSEVYYIGGKMGTGKSTLLERILNEGRIRNYHMEIYYDPLIPEKIQSVFIKELDTMITSNAKGDIFAEVKINLDEYFQGHSNNEEDYEVFKSLVEKAIKSLKGDKNNHFILEKAYNPSINYEKVTEVRERLFNEILGFQS